MPGAASEAILVTRMPSIRGDIVEIPSLRSGRLRRIDQTFPNLIPALTINHTAWLQLFNQQPGWIGGILDTRHSRIIRVGRVAVSTILRRIKEFATING